MVVSFFGHAKYERILAHEEKILDFLSENIGDQSACLYFGGYGNFDSFAYECCVKYKKTHPRIEFVFVTPYITLEYQKNHLNRRKKNYNAIVYPEIENRPRKYAIVYRNRWMVEKSDAVICAVKHSFGGAYRAYSYAVRLGKSVYNLFEQNSPALP